MKTSTALRKARALINKGWCKGTLTIVNSNGQTCFCAVGALRQAVHGDPYSRPQSDENYYNCLDFLDVAAFNVSGQSVYNIIALNDGRLGTKENVLKAYDFAIKAAVAQEPVVEKKKRDKKKA